jgi:hypothetical protein
MILLRSSLLAASLLALGCSGSVELQTAGATSTSSSGTSTSSGTGGAGGGVPSASCADAKVLWSAPSQIVWMALAVAPDGSVYTYGLGGVLQKLSADGEVLWQTTLADQSAYRLAAGPGGRLLVGPSDGATTYRAYREGADGMPVELWSLDAQSVGLEPGIWGTRGAITEDGGFVISGIQGGSLSILVLDHQKTKLWTADVAATNASGWALAAADGAAVVAFTRDPGWVTRVANGGAESWKTDYEPQTVGIGDIAVAANGDVYLLGVTDFPSDVPFSVGRIVKGKTMWTTTFPSNADESLTCGVAPLADGGAMVCTGFEHGLMGIQRLSGDGAALWGPTEWFASDCGALGAVNQIAASPDGAVVMVTGFGVAKIVP